MDRLLVAISSYPPGLSVPILWNTAGVSAVAACGQKLVENKMTRGVRNEHA